MAPDVPEVEDRIASFFSLTFLFLDSNTVDSVPISNLSVDTECYGFFQSMCFERGKMQGGLKIHGHRKPWVWVDIVASL